MSVSSVDLHEHRSSRAKRARRIILVCLWPTKIDQEPIAERFRDIAAEAPDLLGNNSLIVRDDIPELFRIEPGSQPSRAHQVGEHHGQLPPFGGIPGGLAARRAWLSATPLDRDWRLP